MQGTILMYIGPINDFRIKSILQDEELDSMLETTYFRNRIPVKVIDIKQTGKVC